MKLSVKLLAALSVVALLAACDSTPKNGGDANAGGDMSANGSNSAMGYLDGDKHQVSDRVFFGYDSSVVDSDGQTTLQKQADYLKAHSGLNVTIEGHCDERGTREYNLALGERRATAAKNYLVSLGVSAGRIQTISYGKERPAVIGDDESAWSQNRRAVTVKTAQ